MNYVEAHYQLYDTVEAALTADNGDVFGYIPEARYKGREKTTAPDATKTYLRVSCLDVDTGGTIGNELRPVVGVITVGLYVPSNVKNYAHKGRLLAQKIKAAFMVRPKNGKVWLHKGLITEPGHVGASYMLRITAEYHYREFRGD